jgi:cytochrome c biogenesis protein CcmG/thiol:disulfide interchange protein DsbE
MAAFAERVPAVPLRSLTRRDVRQVVAIFVTILIVVLVLGTSGARGQAGASFVGKPAPDFVLSGGDGVPIRLSDMRGHPVWVSFFSSWCTRCRAENPDIQTIYEEQRRTAGDLVILGVGVAESAASVREYASNAGLTFPIGADGQRSVSGLYAVLTLPTHVFIDREGVVREVRVGALPPETMRTLVAVLGSPAAQR